MTLLILRPVLLPPTTHDVYLSRAIDSLMRHRRSDFWAAGTQDFVAIVAGDFRLVDEGVIRTDGPLLYLFTMVIKNFIVVFEGMYFVTFLTIFIIYLFVKVEELVGRNIIEKNKYKLKNPVIKILKMYWEVCYPFVLDGSFHYLRNLTYCRNSYRPKFSLLTLSLD